MYITQSPQVKTAALQYSVDFNWWPIDWLANYIKKKQRETITEKSIAIQKNIDLIRNNCVHQNIFIQQLDELFPGSLSRLWAHMKKEEENLFPVIRKMAEARELNRCISQVVPDNIECIIESLNDEHDIESGQLNLSTQLRDNDKAWKDRTKNVKALYTGLLEFEQDLELHIYLQSKFLFPKLMINMR